MSETQVTSHVDPAIAEAVQGISERFGVQGLCDLIALARDELEQMDAEQA